ncbi:hypothetical protein PCS_02323 [Desulfocurvibacter africanus PCS]|uniref:Uncharacterized protein n=1 Tax=Desulfocurvibacter africanus PCS TaxID=1262666 RepID=M5Q1W1_DESAF|nr:hypothetical protein [Desulfocurvibacter africanus]EMG36903.1 hypothetical protein PCS_02323 [Desulfocurvibacter africanus PCS]
MCPTTRGSRPEEDIIELMDVMEEGIDLQAGESAHSSGGEADALLLDDVVIEPLDDDVLELTEALDEDSGLVENEGILDLTDPLEDDAEDLGDAPVSKASTEEISSAGREDEEIDLAELDELLRDIENEDTLAGASKGEGGELNLHGLSGAGQEIDLADIDSLLRELEEDGGNTEADLIPAGLEAYAGAKPEPGTATVEYILSGLEDKMDAAASTELRTMNVAVQPEQSEAEEFAKPDALGELGELDALTEDEQLAKLLGDDEEDILHPQEDALLLTGEDDYAAVEAATQGAPVVELPTEVPDFSKSPVPDIPVELVDWQATAAFASTRGPGDLLREPEETPMATVDEVRAPEPQTPSKPAAASASEQRMGWRMEALETLVKDELAKARTLADRVADVEVYVMAAPKPEEWTEVMEAVSALRSEPSAPSVDPEEISGLRERLNTLESELSKAPAIADELEYRLKNIEEQANQVGLKDIEDLRQSLETLGQRLDAQPSPDFDGLQQRLAALEERPEGLTQEDLTPLAKRLDDLGSLASRIAEVESALAGKAASGQLDEPISALQERIAALESRPVLDEAALGNLDDLRQKLIEVQAGYEDLVPAASLVSSVAAMDGRLTMLESRPSEVTAADLQRTVACLDELTVRLDGKAAASALSGLEERFAALEAAEATGKSGAAEGDAQVRSLTERMEGLEARLQAVQAERMAELEKRLAAMESGLASQPAAPAKPAMAEIVTEVAERVEDKVFDRVEIVLSGRMIDQIERLENSLPDQIEEIMAKRQSPAPSVDEEALAARLVDKLAPSLERQMAVKVEQLLSARLKTVGLELETTLAESLETPLAERLESSFAERFGTELRDKLEEFLEGTVMGSLRDELMDEIRRTLPKATAKVVREEIEAIKSRM